jgi:hypothetical protein
MAHKFSAALRASCALVPRVMLADGVRAGVENTLAALRAAEIYFHSHAQEGGYACHAESDASL